MHESWHTLHGSVSMLQGCMAMQMQLYWGERQHMSKSVVHPIELHVSRHNGPELPRFEIGVTVC